MNKRSANSLPTNAPAAEGGPALEVQVLYEDFQTGLRAKQAIDGIAIQLGVGTKFQMGLWRFDLLQEPALCAEVANAAVRADVVLLSAHGQHGLPEAVQRWLAGWLSRTSDEPPALVVLLDAAAQQTISAHHWLAALQLRVRPAGVELFPHFGELNPFAPNFTFETNQPETTWAVLAETSRRPGTYLHRNWGLNE